MKIRTKIAVNYNKGVAGTESGIVEGYLENTSMLDNFNTVGVNYMYAKPPTAEGNVEVLIRNSFSLTGEDIDTFYEDVLPSIPPGLGYRDTQRYAYNLAFMQNMAVTFNIAISDVEIVVD